MQLHKMLLTQTQNEVDLRLSGVAAGRNSPATVDKRDCWKETVERMVTDTKEGVDRVMDTMGNGFRAAIDAGQRTQEAFFRASREALRNPGEFDRFFTRSEKVTREWVPFVERNMSAIADVVNTNMRAGIQMFRETCDIAVHSDDTDLYKRTRQFWNNAFEAMRTNFDTVAQAATRSLEACSMFCDCGVGCQDEPRRSQGQTQQQPAKAKTSA